MKSDRAVAEKISEREMQQIAELHNWFRVGGDRQTTLALIPFGLSKQGYQRLAEYCAKMAL